MPLANIRSSFKKANFLLLLTLGYNKRTILGTINIIQKLAEWLALINKVLELKLYPLKKI